MISIAAGITRGVSRALLLGEKHLPDILTGGGIIVGIVGVVKACKATLKVDRILEDREEKAQAIEDVHDGITSVKEGETYTDEDYENDKKVLKVNTVKEVIKAYALPVGLLVASVVMILAGHGILMKRNGALAAGFTALQGAFNQYRSRVAEWVGPEEEQMIFNGYRAEVVEDNHDNPEKDENGHSVATRKTNIVAPDGAYSLSPYAKVFDESNPNWSNTPEYTKLFLTNQQNYFNDLLRSRGHVFLNDVYRKLGFEDTSAGAVVGWVIGKNRDNFIDFGLGNINSLSCRQFINGESPYVMLDFNVDGVIYDLI